MRPLHDALLYWDVFITSGKETFIGLSIVRNKNATFFAWPEFGFSRKT